MMLTRKKASSKGNGSYSNVVVDRESMLSGSHGEEETKKQAVTYVVSGGTALDGFFPNPTDMPITKAITKPTIPDQVVSTPRGAVVDIGMVPSTIVTTCNTKNNRDAAPPITQNCVDMSMSITSTGMRAIIKECVKNKLFRCVKFFDREKHGFYSENLNTACGLVIKFCHIAPTSQTQAFAWWREVRPLVIKTISDHRNNCIKSMRTVFGRKYLLVWINMVFSCCLYA
jgi:hypothetical protein